jgi:hypothetical protein
MHKFKNNEQPIIFKDIISQGSNNTRSDSENKYKIDPQLRKGDTIYDIISAWNQANSLIRKSSTTKECKNWLGIHRTEQNQAKLDMKCTRKDCYSCKVDTSDKLLDYMKR